MLTVCPLRGIPASTIFPPISMKYIVGETIFSRELGHKIRAGETIELNAEAADAMNQAHPGLLRKETVKTVAAPTVVRVKATPEKVATTKLARKKTK